MSWRTSKSTLNNEAYNNRWRHRLWTLTNNDEVKKSGKGFVGSLLPVYSYILCFISKVNILYSMEFFIKLVNIKNISGVPKIWQIYNKIHVFFETYLILLSHVVYYCYNDHFVEQTHTIKFESSVHRIVYLIIMCIFNIVYSEWEGYWY